MNTTQRNVKLLRNDDRGMMVPWMLVIGILAFLTVVSVWFFTTAYAISWFATWSSWFTPVATNSDWTAWGRSVYNANSLAFLLIWVPLVVGSLWGLIMIFRDREM